MKVDVNFSGQIFWVEVDASAWNKAGTALGMTGIPSATAKKEQLVTAKLIEASGPKFSVKCKAPRAHDHDVILELNGRDHTVDIKVLYPDVGMTRGSSSASDILETLMSEADHAFEKEKRQGNICCFDLSYLNASQRQSVVSVVNNSYPNCITLEYDYNGAQLHVVWPVVNPNDARADKVDRGRHVHIGPADDSWYKATAYVGR